MRYTFINFLILLCFSSEFGFAQQLVSHPLSNHGIGDHQLNDHGIYSAMGNTFAPMLDSGQLNYLNPASYASLSKGNTLFSVGVGQRIGFFEQNGEKDIRPNGNLNHLALGFRMKKHFGMAFGLKPMSGKGYYLTEKVYTGQDSLRNTYQGSGYINQVFLGGTYAPINKKGTYVGIGINAGYNFGTVFNKRSSQLIQGTTASGGLMEELISVYDLNYELGLSAYQKIGSSSDLRFGLSWRPEQKLNSQLERSFYSATNLNTPSSYDTLFSNVYAGHVIQGEVLNAGVAYRIAFKAIKQKNRTLHPELTLAGQITKQAAYRYEYNGLQYDSMQSQGTFATKYGLGIEFKPEKFLYENIATLRFFDKFTYRMGAYLGTLPLFDASNQPFNEKGITFGLGIPVLAQQSFSSINFSCTLGQRGTATVGSLQEKFIAFQLAAILSPASFERWFRKRKMD
jgi:hypothetical protein